ncbi:CD36 family domain-containing protein [Ditylenchus destructor]|uniref:CD36 family domain-containing protein n=1 Tax=Ditylenchus destructor TaxID=166010 RepID=A0AAD4R5L4_9BILA|nr:CD36 family domain-containing protein [Ditylenchus destructor]
MPIACFCRGLCCWCCVPRAFYSGPRRRGKFGRCPLNGWACMLVYLAMGSAVGSIAFWAILPDLYTQLLHSRLVLSQTAEGGQLSPSTHFWAHPPADTLMHFYMFNVENAANVTYLAAKPRVTQKGPFVVRVVENKRNLEFFEDDTKLRYRNYKTFIFDPEKSCKECQYNTSITQPNLVAIGALAKLKDFSAYNLTPVARKIIDYGIILLGETNFIDVKFGELMFDGYSEALLQAAHSPSTKLLSRYLNNGSNLFSFPLPESDTMAMFYKYNNTDDGEYVIETGKRDISQVGKIDSWSGLDQTLPMEWWSTSSARMINGSDSGAFQPPGDVNRSSVLNFFSSYMCRSFRLQYHSDSTIEGIPSLNFRVSGDDFGASGNSGFSSTNFVNCTLSGSKPDCSLAENLCHSCCNGSFVNGTYLLPAGMYPISCYPGRNKTAEFQLIYSAPHFAYSPPEVFTSVDGLSPNSNAHVAMSFDYEPTTGNPVQVRIQFQISVPIFRNRDLT